jgi:hypothetical protein
MAPGIVERGDLGVMCVCVGGKGGGDSVRKVSEYGASLPGSDLFEMFSASGGGGGGLNQGKKSDEVVIR